MANYILTADLHLTDNPLDEYRWDVFKHLRSLSNEYEPLEIFILGDFTDRKDRHSGKLVNRFIEELVTLPATTILMGNHDAPVKDAPYWKFLGDRYITKPARAELFDGFFWLLPFSPNPLRDWRDLDLGAAKALFMHQTLSGSLIEGDRKLLTDSNPMPDLPGIPIFSGDVHRPQDLFEGGVRKITYIGAPHPVKFSETWENRLLILSDDVLDDLGRVTFTEFWMPSIKRAILDISSTKCLDAFPYSKGDQIKVRYQLAPGTIPYWPSEEEKIRNWAKEKEITLVSLEATLEEFGPKFSIKDELPLHIAAPKEIMRQYCAEEKVDPNLEAYGQEIVSKVCSS